MRNEGSFVSNSTLDVEPPLKSHPYLPRDARGRRIPKAGTLRRRIYDMWTGGCSTQVIAKDIDRPLRYVNVTIWTFSNPERHNASIARCWRKRKLKQREAAT
jgi:hypothetical protein